MMRSLTIRLRALAILALSSALLTLCGCANAPYTGRSQLIIMSEKEEMQLGLEASQQVLAEEKRETGTYRARLVEKIGRDIAAVAERPDFDWQFHTIVSAEVNAFCLPGGRVFVYTGILELVGNNEMELAAIMGHEIAHALVRHGAERSSQSGLAGAGLSVASMAVGVATNSSMAAQATQLGGSVAAQLGFLLPYSRLHESEADHIGVILAAKAGYDPRGAISLWEKMAALNEGSEPLGILSTHPLNRERQENLRKLMPEALSYYRKK
ncbi:MAG: M48 family metallopeptidase [Deltaproteobacteria bacterium]|jgi:predicted Zn-dependent protease|nr:M48 family metallopeptidase [Deltaproteobacteria bacterium]